MPALLKQFNQFNESYSTAQRHFHHVVLGGAENIETQHDDANVKCVVT
jgi:hypothetical protein